MKQPGSCKTFKRKHFSLLEADVFYYEISKKKSHIIDGTCIFIIISIVVFLIRVVWRTQRVMYRERLIKQEATSPNPLIISVINCL